MPVLMAELWTFECGVCGLETQRRAGDYPESWRRLNIRPHAPAGWDARLGLHDLWRATRFEDWVCSPGCAVAVVLRAWDQPRERARRPHELAAVAARVVA